MTSLQFLQNTLKQSDKEFTKFFFIFSGDLPKLGYSELKAILEIYNIDYKVLCLENQFCLISFKNFNEKYLIFFKRLAYCKTFAQLILSFSEDESESFMTFSMHDLFNSAKSFAVRRISVNTKKLNINYESIIGSKIKQLYPKFIVNLNDPELIFIIFCINDSIFVGLEFYDHSNRWSDRRPRSRPFFLPFSLYPKLSRALVNLSRIKEEQLLIDPFCGTGSIGIESCMMNVNFIGIELKHWICIGASKNFSHFNLQNWFISQADSLKIPLYEANSVVTDLPYGITSSNLYKNHEDFLIYIFHEISSILHKGSFFVFMCPKSWKIPDTNYFILVEKHEIFVHRNLTRVIHVLKRC